MRPTRHAAAATLTALILVGSLASCGDGDTNGGDDPTPSATASTSTTPTDTTEPSPSEPTPTFTGDEQAAADAVLGYLDVRDNAYASGRTSKKLNDFATGRAHTDVQALVTQFTTPPEVRMEGEWSHEILSSKSQADGAMVVTDCEDGTNVEIVRQKDGKVLPWISFNDKELPRRLRQTYRVVDVDGHWKVTSLESLPNKVKPC